MATEKKLIDDIRICPFDGYAVMCDGDCKNCDDAEDDYEICND